MIYSNERKLCLSGWLKKHNEKEYYKSLKLQKFLVLYEAFSRAEGETPDFSHLRGYRNGPVFSQVWGDYTKEPERFHSAAERSYEKNADMVNEVRARKCAFVVGTLSEMELSELTHKMNLWKAKEDRILRGEYQVSLSEDDFNDDDMGLIALLNRMYPDEVVENSVVVNLDKKYFVFSREDQVKLTEQHFDTLLMLTEKEELHNPVYVEIDEEGRLIID